MRESEDIKEALNKRCDTRRQQICTRRNAERDVNLLDGWNLRDSGETLVLEKVCYRVILPGSQGGCRHEVPS